LSAFAQDRDLTSYASLIEGVRGVRLGLQMRPGGGMLGTGSHEFGFDIMHRHLSRPLPFASLSIKRLAGHSIKSSLSHLYTLDTRNDPFTATQGHYLKVFQELAGFGGDAQHYKIESESQFSRCFGNGWAYSLALQGGLLQSLNKRAPLFCDRFQVGGPVSIRMFRFNSLGPKDGVDSLGGDVYYSLGTSLFAPIPTRPHWPLKIHSFLNMGQLIQLQSSHAFWSAPNRHLIGSELLTKPSSSIGIGLMYRQGNLRAEVNFGVPITMRAGDGVRKGVQLGIGISFL
jgi:outer membrane protein insertion porin family